MQQRLWSSKLGSPEIFSHLRESSASKVIIKYMYLLDDEQFPQRMNSFDHQSIIEQFYRFYPELTVEEETALVCWASMRRLRSN